MLRIFFFFSHHVHSVAKLVRIKYVIQDLCHIYTVIHLSLQIVDAILIQITVHGNHHVALQLGEFFKLVIFCIILSHVSFVKKTVTETVSCISKCIDSRLLTPVIALNKPKRNEGTNVTGELGWGGLGT